MRTVVTGGCGFIGRALVARLVEAAGADDKLWLVDTLQRHGHSPSIDRLRHMRGVTILNLDLAHPRSIDELPCAVDRVYHLAAIVGVGPVETDPVRVMRTNTLSTLNVFDWFSEAGTDRARLLFSSSSEVYAGLATAGFDLPVPTPEGVPAVIPDLENPRYSYALSKLWGEAYAKYLALQNGLCTVSVRYHNVYGPAMGYDHVIPQVIARIVAREEPFRRFGGEQTRSFCFVNDAAEATRRVMEADAAPAGRVVHIGDPGGEVAIGELYDMLFDLCGWRPREIVDVAPSRGSVDRRCPDTSVLTAMTGFEAGCRLTDGLRQTVDWYLRHPQKKEVE